jgi:hypothetical protein
MKRVVTLLLTVAALTLTGAVANARDDGAGENDRKQKSWLGRLERPQTQVTSERPVETA